MKVPDDYSWRQLKDAGVRPGIESPQEYTEAVERGLSAAKNLASGFNSGPWLDSSQVKVLHWAAYHEVHPWGGHLRVQELIGSNGEKFSPPHLIQSDLKTLTIQSREYFRSEDLLQTAREIASFNTAFNQIKPFLGGNFELGKLMLEHQAQELFGAKIDLDSDLAVYRSTLNRAVRGNIEPLAKLVVEHSGFSEKVQANEFDRITQEAVADLEREHQELNHSH